jgi:hypothetical protein
MKLGYKQYLVAGALVGALTLTRAHARTPAAPATGGPPMPGFNNKIPEKDGRMATEAARLKSKEPRKEKKNCLDTNRPFHERQVDDS